MTTTIVLKIARLTVRGSRKAAIITTAESIHFIVCRVFISCVIVAIGYSS
jgi:uncharacterized membrane protein